MKNIILIAAFVVVSGCGESYRDPFGNTITKEQHERRVANDAAHDALANLMAECAANPRPGCPEVRR